MTTVVISGANGRMGREVIRAISKESDIQLVGAVDLGEVGQDAGVLAGIGATGVILSNDLASVLEEVKPQVMVDFTTPAVVADNVRLALDHGVRPVVGTTGMSQEDLADIRERCRKKGLGGVVAPNFAIGAVLMMAFAETAAKYFPAAEIIEMHHDQKLDAPSGTAIKTAENIARVRHDHRQNENTEVTKIDGVRGGAFNGGIRLHSVRLPGLVAHQEVIFGGQGQTLTIRHDSISRESFMPGVILAIRKVTELHELVYGLENLIFE
ncbi:MAG: 4-hydroxy-tetrahydrodipicolinate reductase [Peptococcaceae bacterium]|nr:4-hydroxy-tetrahydrodipicolinate reductase [Peptococcaceae bacterium]